MREVLAVGRGIAAFALTGLGLLVILRGHGAGADILMGAVLMGAGITLATIGVLVDVVDGRFAAAPRRRS